MLPRDNGPRETERPQMRPAELTSLGFIHWAFKRRCELRSRPGLLPLFGALTRGWGGGWGSGTSFKYWFFFYAYPPDTCLLSPQTLQRCFLKPEVMIPLWPFIPSRWLQHLLCQVPECALHASSYLSPEQCQHLGGCCYPHCTQEETEAQRSGLPQVAKHQPDLSDFVIWEGACLTLFSLATLQASEQGTGSSLSLYSPCLADIRCSENVAEGNWLTNFSF